MDDEFELIEKKRRESVQKSINSLIDRRKVLNQKLVIELDRLRRENNEIESLFFGKVQNLSETFIANEILEKEQRIANQATNVNVIANEQADVIENRPFGVERQTDLKFEENQTNPSVKYNENLEISNIQSEKNVNLGLDTINYKKNEMNINISDYFLKKYVFTPIYIETEQKLLDEKSKMSAIEQLKLKMFVNKRIGQITTDSDHLSQIIQMLKQKSCLLLNELITIKLLQQAKIQVTNCFESYKAYGFLLAELSNSNFHSLFLMSLIHKKETGKMLKSIFSVYFEYLRIKREFIEAYNFFASILNEKPSFDVFFVIEAFLIILGNEMINVYGKVAKGIFKFLVTDYLQMGTNEPSSVRIITMVNKLIVQN